MKQLEIQSTTYAFDPARHLHIADYLDNKDDNRYFFAGLIKFSDLERHRGKRIYHLEFEEPNRLFTKNANFNHSIYEDLFEKVFTICPFTAKWLNEKAGDSKRTPVFFPFDERYIPAKTEKKYDVIYTGHLVSKSIERAVQIISKFNYRFVSGSDSPLVTDHNAGYEEKIRLMAETKITVVQNLLYLRRPHVIQLWMTPGYKKNEAFRQIPPIAQFWKIFGKEEIVAPQLKSRTFEAAFSRSLILCKKDPFNVIERYFEPGKEFIYYTNDTLESTIRDILNNNDRYAIIAENAYQRACQSYTSRKFCEKYIQCG